MSFIRQYRRLFKIEARDSSTKKPLEAIKFSPTFECLENLRNHHLVSRKRESGIEIYYQLNPESEEPVLGAIESQTRFGFVLEVQGDQFPLKYKSALSPEIGKHYFFDNIKGNGTIEIKKETSITEGNVMGKTDAIQIHGSVFHEWVEMKNNPKKLIIKERFKDTIIKEIPIQAKSSVQRTSVKVDLSSLEKGEYRITTDATGGKTKNIYIDDDLATASLQGLVNIYLNEPQDKVPNEGAQFIINFKPL